MSFVTLIPLVCYPRSGEREGSVFLSIHDLGIHIYPNPLGRASVALYASCCCHHTHQACLSVCLTLGISDFISPTRSRPPSAHPSDQPRTATRRTPPPASPAMAAPDTTAVSIRALFGTLIGLITIAVCLRFYARCRQTANLRADDWLTIPVWVCCLPQCKVARQGVLQSN